MPSSYRFVLKDSHPLLQEQIRSTNDSTSKPTTATTTEPSLKHKIGTLFCCATSSSSQQERELTATSTTTNKLQGRSYCTERAQAEGGVQLHDVTMGMKYACMSISDDQPNTLRNVGKTNPWQLQGMKLMLQDTGRLAPEVVLNDEIHKPLSYLLPHYYDLQVDHHIDINGWKGGHVLDTQGYIAHNDTTIVLAYRCTTSLKDWLTNLATTTSLWETKDIEQGHSGVLSGLTDFSKNKETATTTAATPKVGRVHTGFYNNFISSVPAIQQYIDPLLSDTSKPKTFYIVGHSLGGGIAHMAFAYFLLEFQNVYNWNTLPHRLVLVTAGSPRAYTNTMQHRIDHEIEKYPKGKIQALRLVRDKDTVATVPPTSLGFAHCTKGKCVYITKDDHVIINPNLQHIVPKTTFQKLIERHPSIVGSSNGDEKVDVATILQNDSDDDEEEDETAHLDHAKRDAAVMVDTTTTTSSTDSSEDAAYAKKIAMIPRSLRDHMPEFYLQPLMTLLQREKQYGSIVPKQYSSNTTCATTTNVNTTTASNNATQTEIISSPCHGGGGEETVDVEVVAATTDPSATTTTMPKEEAVTKDNGTNSTTDKNIDDTTTKTVPTSPSRSKLFKGILFGRNNNK